MSGSAVLAVSNLSWVIAGRPIVDDVSFVVGPGETVGLVGRSGSGKTTTARLVLRLMRADRGRIMFEGADITALRDRDLRPIRRRLQYVPQHPRTSLNPRLTVEQSLTFNLRVHDVDRKAARTAAALWLDRMQLAPTVGTRYPHELSGGQLQRVAIARALITEPALVVCDEPVSALDLLVQAQVLNLLAELQAETGTAILFVSHDAAVVSHFCDRELRMESGRLDPATRERETNVLTSGQ